MPDAFQDFRPALDSVFHNAVAVTPNDATDLPDMARGLYVGTGGDVVLIPKGGSASVTLKNVPQGSYVLFAVKRVLSTGTTASNIVAGW